MVIIFFIFGLIIGSFLNAVIFRLHTGESFLFNRSHCMHCNHELAAKDLIPLFSYIFLRGRCRYCSKSISWQYPLIEFLTAANFALLAANLEFRILNLEFWYLLTAICFLIVIGVFDYKHYLILDKVVVPAFILALAYNLISGQDRFVSGLLGSAVVAGFFAIQYFVSGGKWIGFGDVKLGLFLGSLLGFKGSIVMLVVAYSIGAVTGITLIMMNRKTLGSKLPFGVFLAISAIIMVHYGQQITDWYFKLIGIV